MRVLQHQAKLAAARGVAEPTPGDRQLRMPLIVEVTGSGAKKPRARRSRRTSSAEQPGLEEL